MTNDVVAWLMGPDIRHINPLYQGENNNPPDVFFVMHFHVDHTVRADNVDLFPGIFAVTAFVRIHLLPYLSPLIPNLPLSTHSSLI